jgi:hypothetical protein
MSRVVIVVVCAVLITIFGILWSRRLPDEPSSAPTATSNVPISPPSINAQEDAKTLRALREAGADLTKSTDVFFRVYFPTQEAADRAAQSVQIPGLTAQVKAQQEKRWLMMLSGQMKPTEQEIAAVSNKLQELADSLGGVYDGWQAKVTP